MADKGFLARAAASAKYLITGKPSGFFPPGEPMAPVAQQAAGRMFDYPFAANLQFRPKTYEGVTFQQLRALADNCDLVRLAIETRKDQLCALKWKITPKDENQKPDERCKLLEAFFAMPDRRLDWATWLRALLEDLFVVDALTIYPRATLGGGVYGFELMDGATIKILIDQNGRTPEPPNPAYQQILKGLPAVDYTADELVYAPRNVRTSRFYGFSQVEQIFVTINLAINRATQQLNYFTKGNMPEGLVTLPLGWNQLQIEEFQQYFDLLMKGNLDARSGAYFVPNGSTWIPMKPPEMKTEFDEWISRIVCYAFSLPPTAFVKQMNRATAESAQDTSLEEGAEPLKQFVSQVINRLIVKYFGITDLVHSFTVNKDTDPMKDAQIRASDVAAKIITRNEARAAMGLPPIEGGDEFDQPQPAAQPGADAEETGEDKPDAETGEDKQKRKKKVLNLSPPPRDTEITRLAIHRLAGALTQFFAAQARPMAEAVGKAYSAIEPAKLAKADNEPNDAQDWQQLADSIVKELDFSEWEKVYGIAAQTLKPVAIEGAEAGLTQLQITSNDMFNLVNKDAIAYSKDRAAEMVGKKLVDGVLVDNPNAKWAITDGTRNYIRQQVVAALQGKQSVAELITQIIKGAAFNEKRAEMVARTEVAKAHIAGNMTAYLDSGEVKGKRWLLAMEPCKICEANAAQGEVPIDDPFLSLDLAPPAHPNCECDVVPVLKPYD